MELPDDVLRLIREYAKPWFKHYKVYKDTLRMMELYSCPQLRRCLQYNPELILPTLVRFEKAYVEYLVALDDYTGDSDHWEFYKWEFYSKRGKFFEIQSEVYRLIHS